MIDNNFYEDRDGNKFWSKNGELHREDGPALEYRNIKYVEKSYFFNGINYEDNFKFNPKSWKIFIKTLIFS